MHKELRRRERSPLASAALYPSQSLSAATPLQAIGEMANQEDDATSRRGRSPTPAIAPTQAHHLDEAESGSSGEDNSATTSAMTSPLAPEPTDSDEPQYHPTLPKPSILLDNFAKGEDGLRPFLARPPTEPNLASTADVAEPFQRIPSLALEQKRTRGAIYEKVGDQGVCKMHKFSVYETATRYYIVGGDVMDERFRILKIDRNADVGTLSVAEDDIVYTKKEMSHLLSAIDDGNKSTGGMKLKCSTWGLLGFIRFTGPYYMLLITKRSQVAMIGGHYVYQIDGTELVPLVTSSNSRFKAEARNAEEARFVGILNNLDLTRSFYFSYSYDITRTLQYNIMRERNALAQDLPCPHPPDYNDMFVWNDHLLKPAAEVLKNTYDWCLPIIHGYIDQAGMSIPPS